MFTKREKQILSLIAQGLTSQAISNLLFISYETVKKHRKNMILKVMSEGLEFDSLLRFSIQEANKNTP